MRAEVTTAFTGYSWAEQGPWVWNAGDEISDPADVAIADQAVAEGLATWHDEPAPGERELHNQPKQALQRFERSPIG